MNHERWAMFTLRALIIIVLLLVPSISFGNSEPSICVDPMIDIKLLNKVLPSERRAEIYLKIVEKGLAFKNYESESNDEQIVTIYQKENSVSPEDMGLLMDEIFSEPLSAQINFDEYIVSEGQSETLTLYTDCLLYTSPSPRDGLLSRMPSSA